MHTYLCVCIHIHVITQGISVGLFVYLVCMNSAHSVCGCEFVYVLRVRRSRHITLFVFHESCDAFTCVFIMLACTVHVLGCASGACTPEFPGMTGVWMCVDICV
eukprot:GDKI01021617.1.p1 GENE.GDKI01021617.1~~GDKI01021617.1.p1  ORF type:complete len:104 (-),score=12.23 GDKI01021617.1:57-368(-)